MLRRNLWNMYIKIDNISKTNDDSIVIIASGYYYGVE